MNIQALYVYPIAVGDPPLLNAGGLHAPYALRLIVELVSDDGISGFGEVPGHFKTRAALEAVRPVVEGASPFHLNDILNRIAAHLDVEDDRGDRPWDSRQAVHVRSAIEVALLDLQGRMLGRPVHELLGGKVRDRVEFSAYLFYKHEGAGGELGFDTKPGLTGWAQARQAAALDPDGIVAQARAMCDEYGFKSIKLKGGAFPPDEEAAAIHAMRAAFGPGTPLRLDPNAIWTVETAIRVGRDLEGVLEYYEDPVRGQEAMAEVRQALDIPMATNMCTTSFEDLPGSVALGSEDVILSDHHFWGGLRPSQDLAAFCRVFGRGLSMHSNSHVGISLAAMTQLGATIPNLTYACDTHYPWQEDEVVAGGHIHFDDGCVEVSDEPGLGVEVDRDELARLQAQYEACGLTHRDDEVEMQKVEPGWKFAATRY